MEENPNVRSVCERRVIDAIRNGVRAVQLQHRVAHHAESGRIVGPVRASRLVAPA